MAERKMALCILGAMIGAGFASGREIMQFFSRFGQFSWLLVGCAAVMMTACMVRWMKRGKCGLRSVFSGERSGRGEACFLVALLACAGGGMVSAAGEIAALTLPVHHARGAGMIITLLAALGAARRPLGILSGLGKILLPAVAAAFLLCMKLPFPAYTPPALSIRALLPGLFRALGYAGMNVMLAAGVLCEAGGQCNARGLCRGAACAGGCIGGLLLLGNAALLPHADALKDAALPTVILLRAYGKTGFYLAAGVFYLAVFTTLIAVLRGMGEMLGEKIHFPYPAAAVLTGLTGLLGFSRIVAVCYPLLGYISLFFIWRPQRKCAPTIGTR